MPGTRARRKKDAAARTIEGGWTAIIHAAKSLARRRVLAVLVFGLLGTTGAAVIGLLRGEPAPAIHDEFSYLLAADTFASGRLTNPPHPHWEHFETFHVIHQPTYASKYPPAQGLMLALGQTVTGRPVAGVWLSVGLMAAATAWMLLAWLPPAWAVIAAAFCTIHVAWLSYWGQSYWGGAIAATGGALAFGALGRLRNQPRLLHGAALGAGLGVMAASRPFEGAITGACLVVSAGIAVRRLPHGRRGALTKALATGAVLVIVALSWLAYYNWRVTGSPLRMPYQVHQAQYAAAPPLLFLKPKAAPTYRHRELERYWREWSTERHLRQQEPSTAAFSILMKTVTTLFTLAGPGALAAIAAVPSLSRQPRFVAIVAPLLLVLLATLTTKGGLPHYFAPVFAPLYVMVGAGLQVLHRRARTRRTANLAFVLVTFFAVYTVFEGVSTVTAPRSGFAQTRAAMGRELESRPAKSLVFVAYDPDHNYHREWVYNRADIDGAKVVWARSMGAKRDRELIEYFADREVWMLRPDRGTTLIPYGAETP